MAAPTKAFTVIADSRVDPESIIDTDLVTDLRDNDIHLQEVIYGGFTASVAHTHDGVDSALLPGNIAGNLYMFTHFG